MFLQVFVGVEVNGVAVGDPAPLFLPGAPLFEQVAFQATAGSTVRIVNFGPGSFSPGGFSNASINIEKVQ